MSWVMDNLELIVKLTVIHLRQSLIPIVLGLVLSVPLGWVAWRYRLVRGPVIVLTGLLYTIPSLALLILMPAALGYSVISEENLIAALTIYDMAKAVDRGMAITGVRLLEKRGGKSGEWRAAEEGKR